ncbi:TM0106 family RecB-like putative nuclease [Rubrivivax rivuli]|uniref:TM0106 family RecB-like putative nuclease n=1 Tax=Rubrivivax rivuli TaxID=1862385 RepID=A0A437RLJ6_9BURK|nr:TM0106 family RecB-like putative nuclease [Rubrivivax rivuli]RVU47657.1 TM0106 family RecB-like putative nuclease [Rubrivivax rivuli]
MQRVEGERLYSATDLVAFLECEHLSALDLRALDDEALRAERSQADESQQLIADKGDAHEKRHLADQHTQGRQVVDIAAGGGSISDRVQATLAAMRAGVEVIYQATLRDGCWVGHADFLRRVDGVASSLGAWSYEVADTKLARSPKAKFLLQLAFYSDLVAKAQGVAPRQMHVVLGDGTERNFRVADYAHYLESLRTRFLAAIEGLLGATRQAPYPVPCEHCDLCHWSKRCERRRLADDHLSQVAGITRIQTSRLQEAGVSTMAALAALPADARVARIQPETLVSHLASTHHESVRSFLNALIGKRAALDLAEAPEDDAKAPDLGMGDETSDGAAAVEAGDVQASSTSASKADATDESKRLLQQRQRYVQDTQRSIVDGVEAFLKTLRERAQTQPLGVVDLLRLRALLVVVLGAGSKKADLRPKDLNAEVRRRQVLPSRGDASWRGRIGRLLFEFFRDHAAARPPLIKSLHLEADDNQGLPEDVLECWATCFWAMCAMRVATDDAGAAFEVTSREAMLADDLYRFSRLLPQQSLGAVVQDVFAGMKRRYAERLGVSAERLELEHRALVDIAFVRSGVKQA